MFVRVEVAEVSPKGIRLLSSSPALWRLTTLWYAAARLKYINT
jgi:hypothetical protein